MTSMISLPAKSYPLIWDEIAITYNGADDIDTVTYLSLGQVVRVMTFIYSGTNLVNIEVV